MSSNVFVIRCDPDDFDRTVRSAVSLADYPDHPDALPEGDEVRFWGVEDGDSNQTYFEKMEAGDLVLFYQDDTYVGTGRIGTTFTDDESWASTTVWHDTPASRIFTVDEFTPVSVPRAAVNRIFDYADGYNPGGLMRVADDRVARVRQRSNSRWNSTARSTANDVAPAAFAPLVAGVLAVASPGDRERRRGRVPGAERAHLDINSDTLGPNFFITTSP